MRVAWFHKIFQLSVIQSPGEGLRCVVSSALA